MSIICEDEPVIIYMCVCVYVCVCTRFFIIINEIYLCTE